MIVWGGQGGVTGILNTGGRYNPATDSWTATSTTNAPEARYYHTAVWAGSTMIVWGGIANFNGYQFYANTGGKYCVAVATSTPTPTPTATATATATATPTATATATATPTATATATATPTATATATATPTATATATATPTATATATATPTATPTIQVTVQTTPAGRSFTVDNVTYSSTQIFSWVPGSTHAIATTSPQSAGTGVQYAWTRWSDNGTITHNVTPTTNTTYTATFRLQYLLTMVAGTGGTVSPMSGYKNSGAVVSIHATPTNNAQVSYSFSGWTGSGTGSYSGMTNPVSITMNGPITETAAFTQNPVQVTVQTNPVGRSFSVDGNTYTSTQTFGWVPGSSHTIATT